MTAILGASNSHLPIYPYYCRALSHTLGRWCPLSVADVHALEEVAGFTEQNVYFWKNHMIKYVRLTGIIVAVEEFAGMKVYTLDDSSGINILVTCTAPVRPTIAAEIGSNIEPMKSDREPEAQKLISPDGPDLTNIDVGSVVKVKGGIGIFRYRKMVRLKVIALIGDTNAEVKCWDDATKFKQEILSTPWIVSEEELEKCRLDEDREARWQMEEVAKRKKDEMRRYLREKTRELQGKRKEVGLAENAGGENGDGIGLENRKKPPKKISMSTEERRRKEKREGQREESPGKDRRGLGPENRVNYPSKAARRRAAGKYDALGI